MYWYLPDRRWWLRLLTLSLLSAAIVALSAWDILIARGQPYPFARSDVLTLSVAVLWLLALLPNELLALAQAVQRNLCRAAYRRGRVTVMPVAEIPLPAASALPFPHTQHGVFPRPDYSLAAILWQLIALIAAIGWFAVSGGLTLVFAWFAVTGQFKGVAAYLRANGITLTPGQILLGAVLMLPFAFGALLLARRPSREIPFTLRIDDDGVTWQATGCAPRTVRWEDARLFEVALPPYEPELPPPQTLVFVLSGRNTTIWWHDQWGRPLSAAALIAQRGNLPLVTLEPVLSNKLPRPWHILSGRTSYLTSAGYQVALAAGIVLFPPVPSPPVDAVLLGLYLAGALLQLGLYAGLAVQATVRQNRVSRHPPTTLAALPPVPADNGATYRITYQAKFLGRVLAVATGLPLACSLVLFGLWEAQSIIHRNGLLASLVSLFTLAILYLGVLGILRIADAVIGMSRRWAVEADAEGIALIFLGRLGQRKPHLVTRMMWAEIGRMVIRIREGRVMGYRVFDQEGAHFIPWPALPGPRVQRADGGTPITAAEFAALVAERSGCQPEMWDQTGQPSEAARRVGIIARVLDPQGMP